MSVFAYAIVWGIAVVWGAAVVWDWFRGRGVG